MNARQVIRRASLAANLSRKQETAFDYGVAFSSPANPTSAMWLYGVLRVEDGHEPKRVPLPEVAEGGERSWVVLEDEHGRVLTVHADCSVTWDGDRERLLRCVEAIHATTFTMPGAAA